ncbi:MAG TPA: sigma-70 family RNA polymerase sigma factor [Planctomycetota bacterium]|nr:sigma-70 family RNA polymerase sigma factor [Planctomycetota bacterium]
MSQSDMTRDFLQNRQALLGFIFALTRDPLAAEEIFQEVALAILREAATGTSVDPFLPWAREVARRRVAEHYRKATARERVAPLRDSMVNLISQSYRENEENPGRDSLRLDSLRRCVDQLAGRAREVIDLRYRLHLGIEKIAAELAWRADSVNVLLTRTRRILADCVRSKLSSTETR